MEDIEREVMEFDVVIVGAGPAGLAVAMRLKQRDPGRSVCVLEKGAFVGAHSLAGAVIETEVLDTLVPDWRDDPPSICVQPTADEFWLFTASRRVRLPTPPQMHNEKNTIVSLANMLGWLVPKAEALGVEIYPGFAAAAPLFGDEGQVIGVRTTDMGLDIESKRKPNFEPGIAIQAAVTIFAEGCRGHCTKTLIKRYGLDADADPQTYGIGLKELWRVPKGQATPGLVQHTIGWPLSEDIYGGSFVYHLDDERIALGFVVGLDYADPRFSPFEAFQQWKHHPSIRKMLDGGEILSAGSRSLVEGGWQSLPRVELPGALLIGDTAGTLNVPKIKGVHTAMQSGILAADHLLESNNDTAGYDAALRASAVGRELKRVRNIRPGFRKGLRAGLANAVIETATGGRLPWTLSNHADWSAMEYLDGLEELAPAERQDYRTRDLPPRDRSASVFHAQTEHDENQPVHLQILQPDICTSRCTVEFGNPCQRFCPAAVYEMVEDDAGDPHLQINAANCVHCKTCDIKDPYQIINWVVPEGGSGPNYQDL